VLSTNLPGVNVCCAVSGTSVASTAAGICSNGAAAQRPCTLGVANQCMVGSECVLVGACATPAKQASVQTSTQQAQCCPQTGTVSGVAGSTTPQCPSGRVESMHAHTLCRHDRLCVPGHDDDSGVSFAHARPVRGRRLPLHHVHTSTDNVVLSVIVHYSYLPQG
jgi:hypothetical protein